MSNAVTCRFRGHTVQVARVPASYPAFNLGIDGRLVGVVNDTGHAIAELSESFRVAFTPTSRSVTLPKRFRDAVAELAD